MLLLKKEYANIPPGWEIIIDENGNPTLRPPLPPAEKKPSPPEGPYPYTDDEYEKYASKGIPPPPRPPMYKKGGKIKRNKTRGKKKGKKTQKRGRKNKKQKKTKQKRKRKTIRKRK